MSAGITAYRKPSQIVKDKMDANGGTIHIPLLNGDLCSIIANKDGQSFTSDKLNHEKVSYEYRVFDVIVEHLLSSPGCAAKKGAGRGKEDKVGTGKCTVDTVLGNIAVNYMGKQYGESCFDPIFVLAAVLEWAGIAHNMRGKIQLTTEYLASLRY